LERPQAQLAAMLCDVGHFKQYDDCYGHTAGEKFLRTVAEVLSATFKRAGEACVRCGREETATVPAVVSDAQASKRLEMARLPV
jgi:diguanylate cyclase (GGDEF)-like protein